MGMFDDIRCEHSLPAPNAEGLIFQTKDLDCDLDQLLIKADGTLWRVESGRCFSTDNPIGHLFDFFGEVHFYTFGRDASWLEFRARFVDGKLHGPIVLIEDTRPPKDSPPSGACPQVNKRPPMQTILRDQRASVLTKIKQWLCSHRFDLAHMQTRDEHGIVRCRCYKCGGMFAAEYGLALPGVFDRNSSSRGGQQ
jgi:hypothetical protein